MRYSLLSIVMLVAMIGSGCGSDEVVSTPVTSIRESSYSFGTSDFYSCRDACKLKLEECQEFCRDDNPGPIPPCLKLCSVSYRSCEDRCHKGSCTTPPGWYWSSAGAIPGKVCVQMSEPGDPHTWNDNYICSDSSYGLAWSYLGPISGMRCTRIVESADPDGWNDNYLCVPPTSSLNLGWGSSGAGFGRSCLKISEPSDPHTWDDNYLFFD